MSNSDKRPVFLNVFQIRLPIPAIVSILHRISGVVLFISIPVFLYLLHGSTSSYDSYVKTMIWVSSYPGKWIMFLMLSAFACHFWAGIRHLLMDIGFAESLEAGTVSSWIVLILLLVSTVFFAGELLW